ncbi:hypothetical protein WD019_06570 [Fictibacillus sp. Mic-4]|uniref:hypothetical protein n=1 Tax=Fictibacillus sp. Mic-4 TaxID=3132826 RepID=UPI003CF11DD3
MAKATGKIDAQNDMRAAPLWLEAGALLFGQLMPHCCIADKRKNNAHTISIWEVILHEQ